MTDSQEEGAARAPRSPGSTLNTALLASAVVALVYGVPILLIPTVFWGDIGGAEGARLEALESMRWAGGLLGGLGLAAIFAIRDPRGQRTFVTGLSFAAAAAAAGLWLSVLNGEFGDAGLAAWFSWLATLLATVVAAYLWWARFKARDLLGI
jgi:hypothetical protein